MIEEISGDGGGHLSSNRRRAKTVGAVLIDDHVCAEHLKAVGDVEARDLCKRRRAVGADAELQVCAKRSRAPCCFLNNGINVGANAKSRAGGPTSVTDRTEQVAGLWNRWGGQRPASAVHGKDRDVGRSICLQRAGYRTAVCLKSQ